jgi:uncharacterized protein with PIN domain
LYFNQKKDKELIEIAFKEKRILLTRDKNLALNFIVKTLLIKSVYIDEQLKQVIEWFKLDTKHALSRCTICNQLLSKVNKTQIKHKIPALVYDTYHEFYECKICDKIYWPGTHFENIKNKFKNFAI